LDTSGTGQDQCPSHCRAHQAPGPPCGGSKKIRKPPFGFKGAAKNFWALCRLVTETLLADATWLAGATGAADVDVRLQIWPHMIHAWPVWNANLEDGRRALADAGQFIRPHIR
jgi:hypothetical protein